MRERAASYDGSWSSLRADFKVRPRNLDSDPEISSPVAKKRKAGLQTLDGHVFGTVGDTQ